MKFFLSIFFAFLVAFSFQKSNAQVLMNENFSGAVGDSLTNYGWVSFSGGNTNYLRITTPGLTYAGYQLSGIANATTVLNSGQDAYKEFPLDSSGALYVAYMLKVDTVRTGDYFAAMLPNNSSTNFAARMYVKDTTGGYRIGISKGTSASNTIFYSNAVYTIGTTYLVVMKYQFNTGTTTDDRMDMFILASGVPSTEPGSPTIANVTGPATDSPNLARFALRQGTAASSPNLVVDGIRVGQTWADLVNTYTCNYTWTAQTSGVTSVFNTVKAVNDMVVWAAGAAGTIRKTTDGGTTWTNGNPNPGVISGDIYNIEALDANIAWCTSSPTGNTFIYKTTNGGTNWVQVHSLANGFFNGIVFRDSLNGFVEGDPVGGRWSLFRTTNSGVTWDSTGMYLPQAGGEAGWNNSVVTIGNTIWFGTNNTRVYKSTNFGASWVFSATTGVLDSYGIAFNDGSNGVAGGENLLRTTDGGATYTSIGTAPGTGNILGVDGNGTNFWYGRGTGIYRSSNGGANFTSVYTTTGGNVIDLDVVPVGGCVKGWAVMDNGSIAVMNSTLTGTENTITEIPNAYKLEQNYPNPFNPSTKISFALPVSGDVTLKVFDITGKEVASLVQGFRQAGSYLVDFNASELSSGIYFYTLRTGNFVESKKMLLVK